MKNFKTHFIKYDFKLTTGNLNNLKKFEFSKNEKFQTHLIEKLKKNLKHDFQARYRQFKQFEKIQISKNEKFQSPPYRETKETPKT